MMTKQDKKQDKKQDIILNQQIIDEVNIKRQQQGKRQLIFEDFIFAIRKGKTLKEIELTNLKDKEITVLMGGWSAEREISLKTGGQFFRATDKDALADIYKEIDKLERSEIEVKDYTKYNELYILFLIPTIIIVFLYIIIKKYLFRVRV